MQHRPYTFSLAIHTLEHGTMVRMECSFCAQWRYRLWRWVSSGTGIDHQELFCRVCGERALGLQYQEHQRDLGIFVPAVRMDFDLGFYPIFDMPQSHADAWWATPAGPGWCLRDGGIDP